AAAAECADCEMPPLLDAALRRKAGLPALFPLSAREMVSIQLSIHGHERYLRFKMNQYQLVANVIQAKRKATVRLRKRETARQNRNNSNPPTTTTATTNPTAAQSRVLSNQHTLPPKPPAFAPRSVIQKLRFDAKRRVRSYSGEGGGGTSDALKSADAKEEARGATTDAGASGGAGMKPQISKPQKKKKRKGKGKGKGKANANSNANGNAGADANANANANANEEEEEEEANAEWMDVDEGEVVPPTPGNVEAGGVDATKPAGGKPKKKWKTKKKKQGVAKPGDPTTAMEVDEVVEGGVESRVGASSKDPPPAEKPVEEVLQQTAKDRRKTKKRQKKLDKAKSSPIPTVLQNPPPPQSGPSNAPPPLATSTAAVAPSKIPPIQKPTPAPSNPPANPAPPPPTTIHPRKRKSILIESSDSSDSDSPEPVTTTTPHPAPKCATKPPKTSWRQKRLAIKLTKKAPLAPTSTPTPRQTLIQQLHQYDIEALETLVWELKDQMMKIQALEYTPRWPRGAFCLNLWDLRGEKVEMGWGEVKMLERVYGGFVGGEEGGDGVGKEILALAHHALHECTPHHRILTSIHARLTTPPFHAQAPVMSQALSHLLARECNDFMNVVEVSVDVLARGKVVREEVGRLWEEVRGWGGEEGEGEGCLAEYVRKREQLNIVEILMRDQSDAAVDEEEMKAFQKHLQENERREHERNIVRAKLAGLLRLYSILMSSLF
ncbi:hypothetical protein HDU98_008905, partial [Podochytrium sp. JEL0797]